MFYLADTQDSSYHELWDVIPVSAVVKGEPAVVQDVFGFYLQALAANAEGAFIYDARQVRADKAVGSGESIEAGDEVYYVVATGKVTASPTGTIGTEYYFCGWAKKDASETETTVLIRFYGTEYNHADRAA